MRHDLVRTLAVGGLFVCAVLRAADPPKPPTTTELSTTLTKACTALKVTKDPGNWDRVTCAAKDQGQATADEVSTCRDEVFAAAAKTFTDETDLQIVQQTTDLLGMKGIEGDSAIAQRLQSPLFKRQKVLEQAIVAAVKDAWKKLTVEAKGTNKLKESALIARDALVKNGDFQPLRDAVMSSLLEACIGNNATLIEAIIPKPAESNANLNRLLGLIDRQPDLITKECTWAEGCKGDPIFVNGDHISTVYVTGIPASSGTPIRVTVSAGESLTDYCRNLNFNYSDLTGAHDVVAIPLYMRYRSPWPFVLASPHDRETFTRNLYGWIDDPCKKANADKELKRAIITGNGRAVEVAAVPLVVTGRSQIVTIEFTSKDNLMHKTFVVPIRYQRYWLDAGGFFAFAQTKTEDLIKASGGTAGTVKVQQIRSLTDLNASTGIVVNIHPGNFPFIAYQFGIATQQQHLPSYYLGAGGRLREIGTRGLATFAAGIAAIQVDRFPGLRNFIAKDIDAGSPLLIPTRKYSFTPYFSISLGFSFGGVSEKTDVSKTVTSQ